MHRKWVGIRRLVRDTQGSAIATTAITHRQYHVDLSPSLGVGLEIAEVTSEIEYKNGQRRNRAAAQ